MNIRLFIYLQTIKFYNYYYY